MSDLQCAARMLLTSGLDQSSIEWLAGERVSLVYDGTAGSGVAAAAAAKVVSDALGVAVRATDEPVPLPDVVAGQADAVDGLRPVADLHRGETVVVLGAGLDADEVHELLLDGDGSTVRRLR